jgi:hypothetical protein
MTGCFRAPSGWSATLPLQDYGRVARHPSTIPQLPRSRLLDNVVGFHVKRNIRVALDPRVIHKQLPNVDQEILLDFVQCVVLLRVAPEIIEDTNEVAIEIGGRKLAQLPRFVLGLGNDLRPSRSGLSAVPEVLHQSERDNGSYRRKCPCCARAAVKIVDSIICFQPASPSTFFTCPCAERQ